MAEVGGVVAGVGVMVWRGEGGGQSFSTADIESREERTKQWNFDPHQSISGERHLEQELFSRVHYKSLMVAVPGPLRGFVFRLKVQLIYLHQTPQPFHAGFKHLDLGLEEDQM